MNINLKKPPVRKNLIINKIIYYLRSGKYNYGRINLID